MSVVFPDTDWSFSKWKLIISFSSSSPPEHQHLDAGEVYVLLQSHKRYTRRHTPSRPSIQPYNLPDAGNRWLLWQLQWGEFFSILATGLHTDAHRDTHWGAEWRTDQLCACSPPTVNSDDDHVKSSQIPVDGDRKRNYTNNMEGISDVDEGSGSSRGAGWWKTQWAKLTLTHLDRQSTSLYTNPRHSHTHTHTNTQMQIETRLTKFSVMPVLEVLHCNCSCVWMTQPLKC